MIDSYGRKWSAEEGEFNKYLRNNGVNLVISYNTDEKTKKVYCLTECYYADNLEIIFNMRTDYPLTDDSIFNMLRSILRDRKLKELLD
jgi:hypothetical protein